MKQVYYTREKHKECIIEMVELTGIKATLYFCLNNAYKYAYRAGLKTKNKTADMEKMQWYLEQCKEHSHELNTIDEYVFNMRYKRVVKAINELIR